MKPIQSFLSAPLLAEYVFFGIHLPKIRRTTLCMMLTTATSEFGSWWWVSDMVLKVQLAIPTCPWLRQRCRMPSKKTEWDGRSSWPTKICVFSWFLRVCHSIAFGAVPFNASCWCRFFPPSISCQGEKTQTLRAGTRSSFLPTWKTRQKRQALHIQNGRCVHQAVDGRFALKPCHSESPILWDLQWVRMVTRWPLGSEAMDGERIIAYTEKEWNVYNMWKDLNHDIQVLDGCRFDGSM